MHDYITKFDKTFLIHIKLTPNAKADKIADVFYDENNQAFLKVYTTAIPEDNKANKALIKLLSKHLKIAKSDMQLIKGHKARLKVIESKKAP